MAPTPTQRRGGACGLDSVAQDNPAGSLDAHGDRVRWPSLQWSRAEWYNPDGPGVGRPGPDHSPARRLPRPRGVTPMTHPRLDSDEPAAAGPTAAAPARPATGTCPWTQLGSSHKDWHQRRRTRFTANWCHVGLRQTRIPSRAPTALGPCLSEFGSPNHSGQPGPTRAGVGQVLHRLRNG